MEITEKSRVRLAHALSDLIDQVWKRERSSTKAHLKSFDLDVVTWKKALHRLAEDLSRAATELTGWWDHNLLQMIEVLRERTTQHARFVRPTKPRSIGRPKGQRKRPEFDRFVAWVYEAAYWEGIELTISSDQTGGTLAKVLRSLRPKLPPGFVPNTLSASSLRRAANLKVDWRYYPLDRAPDPPPPTRRTK